MQIRDIDLMIKILDNPIRYEGIQEDWHTSYQLYLLADMGYIDATVVTVGSDKEIYSNIKVSSVGKDFVFLLGNRNIYRAVDIRLKSKGYSIKKMNFDIILRLAKKEIEEILYK
ncbi:hypothetical protein [Salinicoccus carnicancri]|uniref:hypothetical protein n=1 Tax=Salinicoccus carnicancri TaxID=558170 RepID=UPI00036B26FB|nr:hypothetical protein [Salinicoccus carnicancri]